MANRIAASGHFDDKLGTLFCSSTDSGVNPIVSVHRPENGVFQIKFNPAAFTENITVLVTSTGVAAAVTNDANAYVRDANTSGCTIVTAVWDPSTYTFILANSSFYFSIIETPAGFSTPVR